MGCTLSYTDDVLVYFKRGSITAELQKELDHMKVGAMPLIMCRLYNGITDIVFIEQLHYKHIYTRGKFV